MAHELMRGVPEDRAKRDLHAAVEFLKSQSNVKKDRIGSIGWLHGRRLCPRRRVARTGARRRGHQLRPSRYRPEALKKINAPILGLFGGQDRGITPDDVHKFEQQLKQLGKKVDIKIYDDAGHAFENPNNKDGYRARRRRRRAEAHRRLSGDGAEKITRATSLAGMFCKKESIVGCPIRSRSLR